MNRKNVVTIAVIALIGIALTALILWTEPGTEGADSDSLEAQADYPRGPHGGRLVSDDTLQLEITIYELGVPPRFRVYAFDGEAEPLDPREVRLDIEVHRLGGRLDRMAFAPEEDYLLSDNVVEEPHSFDVKIAAERSGETHRWEHSQIEGKVRLGPDAVESAGITLLTAGPREMVTTLDLPGEIQPDATRVARVVPRVSGVVLEALKQQGDRVRRGELMAVISSRELADAKSAYLASSQYLEFARVTLEREESLWKKKISAEQDYLEAQRAFQESDLQKELAAQKLAALGLDAQSIAELSSAPRDSLPRYEIRAPLAGTVTERSVTVGEAVAADRDIFVIADLSSVWVNVTVYAKDVSAVGEGQEATVRSVDLGREATGHITYVGPLVGETTRAATARLVLANPDGQWRPGLFVSVVLTRDAATVPVAVAAEAIQSFRDWQVVFVRYGEWFEGRPLELGRSDGEWVEVRSGLAAGEQYAAANSFAVKAEIGKLGATHDH